PARATTRIVAVSLPEAMRTAPRFDDVGRHYVQAIFEHVGRPFDLRLCVGGLSPERQLSNAGVLEDLDFARPVPADEVHANVLTVERAGRIDGFLAGALVTFAPGVTLDLLDGGDHGQLPVFFPVFDGFDSGLEVEPGDTIHVTCTRAPSEDGLHPDFVVH